MLKGVERTYFLTQGGARKLEDGKPKILMYSYDPYGLEHSRGTLALAETSLGDVRFDVDLTLCTMIVSTPN
jgi:hypothetical protein